MEPITNSEFKLILSIRHDFEVFMESTFHLISRNFLINIRAMLVELIGVFQPL